MVDRSKHVTIWRHTVQRTLVINPLCFPTVAICCTLRQVNVGEFSPGKALHVDVDLTTVHTLVRFWFHPSKQITLQVCHRRYEKELTCALRTRQSLLCQWSYIGTSALNCYEIRHFSEYFSGFAWFPNLVRPNLTVHSAERTLLFLAINLSFGSPITSWSLGMRFFHIQYI